MSSPVALGGLLRRARATPVRRLSLVLIAVLSYALVSLWPFTWDPPRLVDNGARWTTDGSLRFETPGLALTPTAPAWLPAVAQTGRLEITLGARPFASSQNGAHILSISRSSYDHALHLAQQGRHLVVRLHRACRSQGLWPRRCESTVRARNVFAAGQRVELAVSIAPGHLRLRVDGADVMENDLPPDALRPWDGRHRLTLGNDVSGNRPWLGEVTRLAVRASAGGHDDLVSSGVVMPDRYWHLGREPKLVPFRHVPPRDAVNNLIFYMPLGMLLALLRVGQGPYAVIWAFLLIGGVSVVMETMQVFVATRTPSITDSILNAVGGTLGFLACHLLSRSRRSTPAAGR